MIQLKCSKCGMKWYTSSFRPDDKCDYCGGTLVKCNCNADEGSDIQSNRIQIIKSREFDKSGKCSSF